MPEETSEDFPDNYITDLQYLDSDKYSESRKENNFVDYITRAIKMGLNKLDIDFEDVLNGVVWRIGIDSDVLFKVAHRQLKNEAHDKVIHTLKENGDIE